MGGGVGEKKKGHADVDGGGGSHGNLGMHIYILFSKFTEEAYFIFIPLFEKIS